MELTKEEQERQNSKGLIGSPILPDLVKYASMPGSKEVIMILYDIECSITCLKNFLISNEIHDEERYGPASNIKFSIYDLYSAKKFLKESLLKRRKQNEYL